MFLAAGEFTVDFQVAPAGGVDNDRLILLLHLRKLDMGQGGALGLAGILQ